MAYHTPLDEDLLADDETRTAPTAGLTPPGQAKPAGIMELVTALAPFAMMLSSNPNASALVNALMMNQYRREQGERADASAAALGQYRGARLQQIQQKAAREEQDKARSRGVFSQMGDVMGQLQTDTPADIIRGRVAGLSALPGFGVEHQAEFTRVLAEQAKREQREALARGFERPYTTRETFTFGAPPPPAPPRPTFDQPMVEEEPLTLGAGPLRMPSPITLPRVPDTALSLSEEIMKTGALPSPQQVELAGLPLERFPGGREALTARQQNEAQLRQTQALARKTESEAGALEVGAPFRAEMAILNLQKLRQEVEQGRMPPLTGDIVNRLRATPGVDPRNPTPEQVLRAINAHETALTARAVDAARQQGLAAANLPARTPVEQQKVLQDMALARSQIAELTKLAPDVNLPNLVGGIRPWANQVIQTGRIGPIPIPAGQLTPAQNRFLALTQDYADSMLRLRSGAQINEQEFQRMLGFLVQPGVNADVFMARMQLNGDLLRARQGIVTETLKGAGYRAPSVVPPDLSGGAPKILSIEREK